MSARVIWSTRHSRNVNGVCLSVDCGKWIGGKGEGGWNGVMGFWRQIGVCGFAWREGRGGGSKKKVSTRGLGTDGWRRKQGSGSLRSGRMVAIAWEVRYVSCRVSLHEYQESLETSRDRSDLEFHGRFGKA